VLGRGNSGTKEMQASCVSILNNLTISLNIKINTAKTCPKVFLFSDETVLSAWNKRRCLKYIYICFCILAFKH
jgi:hypothetical protein